jgi:hypothetical protein
VAVRFQDLTEAILAVTVVGAIVAIAVYDAVTGKPVTIPPELYGFGGIIIGAYFRGRSVNGTISSLTAALQQSVPAASPAAATPPPPGA